VVIIHGMGEQRPLDTLNGFVNAALDPDGRDAPEFYSRPDEVTDSYESRRYLGQEVWYQGKELRAQTEIFEYHWAHLMQGNRLEDLWPTARRMIFLLPWFVPKGLRVVWALLWAVIILLTWFAVQAIRFGVDLKQLTIPNVVAAVLGTGALASLIALAATYLLTRITPRWITSSFVDVVRYLDTSPRSYGVRREIRASIVNLLQGLHDAKIRGKPRYQRIVVVAHSLGSYIAYDAITYLWGQMNELHRKPMKRGDDATDQFGGEEPGGLEDIERAAERVDTRPDEVAAYQTAQRKAWEGIRLDGNPWRITDFVSFGSPMYFANRLMTLNPGRFIERVELRELPTCPPRSDPGPAYKDPDRRRLSYDNGGRRVLYHGAPFAVVRWTNLWFPPHYWFFGDWFGGPLAPLFGNGVRDVPINGGSRWRWTPGFAHALYVSIPKDKRPESVTAQLRAAMDLASSDWLEPTLRAPDPDPTSRGSYVEVKP
jgi:hypothetical protein